MGGSRLASVILVLCSLVVKAQEGRYMVFFKDKAGTIFSIDNPEQFLSQRSIDRRAKHQIVISDEDLPVNADYISQVSATGAEVWYSSKWVNGVLVQVDNSELSDIEALPFVQNTEYVAPTKSSSGGRAKRIKSKKDSNIEVVNQVQTNMIGLDDMHSDGLTGTGVYIAVFDSGFTGVDQTVPFEHLQGKLQLARDLVNRSDNVFQYDDHGTEVLSVMAARQDGVYQGGVPDATYQLFVTEDVSSEFRVEEYNWLVAAEKADSAGVDIINSSLGYNLFDDSSMDYTIDQLDGNTAVVSRAAAIAKSKGILVVESAGNDGGSSFKFINPPADVEGVLAVGAVTSTGNLSSFSSIGPTADGRIKPDVVALGSGVSVIRANGTTGFSSGTSSSTPLITSLAAGLMQGYPELTSNEIFDLIIQSGNRSESPNNQFGYGIPHYLAAKQIMEGGEVHVPTSAILLYPNPISGDTLKISMDIEPGQEATVSIYSLKGQLVFQSEGQVTYGNNPVELDLSKFSAGLYIVRVETLGVLKTFRLVKL
ncbi:MAG: S8 family peptidase [Cyclobacteriaceae bacterium]|nr:S8 family peptidase [Cyclobacteriaceae bacterium]